MALSPDHKRPSQEERDEYYFGFSGQPKLIARTSTNPWEKAIITEHVWERPRPRPARKVYLPVDAESDIASKWSRDVVEEIIRVLEGCSWTFFLPIRIGFEHKKGPDDFPLVLLIVVDNNTLSWDEGILFALACRDVLRGHKIDKVEVEIREGRRHNLAASAELDGLIDMTRKFDRTNAIMHPLLSFSGYAVAYSEDRRGQGSIGLHVKLQGDESIYGLTCRHVVKGGRPADESYTFSPESTPQFHIQASQRSFEDYQHCLLERFKDVEWILGPLIAKKQRWNDYLHLDETKSHLRPDEIELKTIDSTNIELAYIEQFVHALERIEDNNARKIGQLMFHPPLEFSTHQKGYLKDWALIKLDEEKFPGGPKNEVFINCWTSLNDGKPLVVGESSQTGVVPLRHKSDFEIPPHTQVWKVGATTGLTYGTTNGIEAVIRKPEGLDGHPYAWEIAVIPLKGRFSGEGDSGSCVFDSMGRVVGLLTSSDSKGVWPSDGRRGYSENISPSRVDADKEHVREAPEAMDITFVDPIQWVLDDIERFTSRKVELV